jgi:hypothetical protein
MKLRTQKEKEGCLQTSTAMTMAQPPNHHQQQRWVHNCGVSRCWMSNHMVLENIYGIRISFETVYPPSNLSSSSERKFKHNVLDLINMPEFAVEVQNMFHPGGNIRDPMHEGGCLFDTRIRIYQGLLISLWKYFLGSNLIQAGTGGEPLLKGTNFVFDGRLGRPITEDAMGVCVTCGNKTSAVSNCRNDYCHKRMIQCETL